MGTNGFRVFCYLDGHFTNERKLLGVVRIMGFGLWVIHFGTLGWWVPAEMNGEFS